MDDGFDIIHPCSDFGFKLATKKSEVICSFLNTILTLNIETVEVINSELGSTFKHGANLIVDLLCRTAENELILVEMQNDYREEYTTKIFVEFCRLVSSFDEKAPAVLKKRARPSSSVSQNQTAVSTRILTSSTEFWKRITRVISVVLTNRKIANSSVRDPVNNYSFTHSANQLPLSSVDARVVIVSLYHFQKSEKELASPLDRWLFAFKDHNLSSNKKIPEYKHIDSLAAVTGVFEVQSESFSGTGTTSTNTASGPAPAGSDPQAAALTTFYTTLRATNVPAAELREYADSVALFNDSLSGAQELGGQMKTLQFIRNWKEDGTDAHQIAKLAKLSVDVVELVLAASTDEEALEALGNANS